MRKAIRATAIAFIIICAVILLVFGILGSIFLAADQALVDGMEVVVENHVVTGEEALAAIHFMGAVFLIVCLPVLVGVAFDIVLIVFSTKHNLKGALYLAFGIAACVFGQYAPGAISIVYGAKHLKA